jgi:predicted kinase
MQITFPELSLIILIGASGAGKSTFAQKHFKPTEILSSDYFRGLVSDDENDQTATKDAFDVLHYILAKRLAAGKLTVIDATNVQPESRKPLLNLAKQYHCFAVAIVFDLPESVCQERNRQRPNRQFGSHVVRNHTPSLKRSLHNLKREGFRFIYKLSSVEAIEAVSVTRQPLWTNRKQEHGPFDIIGDIHGCCDELEQLLQKLRYVTVASKSNPDSFWYFPTYIHPEGRKAIFLGDLVDREDVTGKRFISTKIHGQITIREDQSIAALEIMSRFAVNPKWLIYLPPTMSPVATSKLPDFLEYPTEAFEYYRQQNIAQVICEEKHMGSRVIIVLCRNESVAEKRFGIKDEGIGVCYTRTGRRFFNQSQLETDLLHRLNQALTESDFWQSLNTDWVCLDCELMPWSAKAQELLKQQYAPVGVAANRGLNAAVNCLQQAQNRGIDVSNLLTRYQQKAELPEKYIKAYRQYCWSVNSIDNLKLAPFHILATEGQVHTNKPHNWHMSQIANFCQGDNQLLLTTNYKIVNLNEQSEIDTATNWWLEMTNNGGEGMVVKPMNFISRQGNKLIQPAVKCRGAEYLRIIYGLEYSLPEHLERLKQRGLGKKRSLALREFALGIESLERFVNHAPLRQVHECVFGVLALESEPVDPRL